MKCQLKQVNGLCWLHLCCRKALHCSTLNSFRYLEVDERGEKIEEERGGLSGSLPERLAM